MKGQHNRAPLQYLKKKTPQIIQAAKGKSFFKEKSKELGAKMTVFLPSSESGSFYRNVIPTVKEPCLNPHKKNDDDPHEVDFRKKICKTKTKTNFKKKKSKRKKECDTKSTCILIFGASCIIIFLLCVLWLFRDIDLGKGACCVGTAQNFICADKATRRECSRDFNGIYQGDETLCKDIVCFPPPSNETDAPTPFPTPSPIDTGQPTESPSISPTKSPTENPTGSPTGSPTKSPSPSPSASPTPNPSDSPTQSPSLSPTTSPSDSPSQSPTSSPTVSPSASPSKSPTISPTKRPTLVTSSPTQSPTISPSLSPTVSPTGSPTQSPTGSPTQSPTGSPTASPSASPSKSPTISPSVNPSVSPTQSPTTSPTASPTINIPEGAGACCLSSECDNFLTQFECESSGGLFAGVNTFCTDPGICSGACCDRQGGCIDNTNIFNCAGLFKGLGTQCGNDTNTCDIACCANDVNQTCINQDIQSVESCFAEQGQLQEFGQNCSETICAEEERGCCTLSSGACKNFLSREMCESPFTQDGNQTQGVFTLNSACDTESNTCIDLCDCDRYNASFTIDNEMLVMSGNDSVVRFEIIITITDLDAQRNCSIPIISGIIVIPTLQVTMFNSSLPSNQINFFISGNNLFINFVQSLENITIPENNNQINATFFIDILESSFPLSNLIFAQIKLNDILMSCNEFIFSQSLTKPGATLAPTSSPSASPTKSPSASPTASSTPAPECCCILIGGLICDNLPATNCTNQGGDPSSNMTCINPGQLNPICREKGFVTEPPSVSPTAAPTTFSSFCPLGNCFERDSLEHPEPVGGDQYGNSVSVSGDLVVIGATTDDVNSIFNAGSAFLYNCTFFPCTLIHNFTYPEPGITDLFGANVAISGTNVVISAPNDDVNSFNNVGSAFLYDCSSPLPCDLIHNFTHQEPATSDQFGNSVAISGTNVVIAARGDDFNSTLINTGSAFLYDCSVLTSCDLVYNFTHPEPSINNNFGDSVAISGTNVVIGTRGDDFNSTLTNTGSAFLYDCSSSFNCVLVYNFTHLEPSRNDGFGNSVSISGTNVVIGARNDEPGFDDGDDDDDDDHSFGSAFVYDCSTPTSCILVANLTSLSGFFLELV